MSLTIEQSQPFEAVAETGITGLTGTLTVRIDNGGTVVGPTTSNIVETDVSGVYTWSAPAAPATLGQYKILWSTDGSYDPETTIEEDLLVILAGTSPIPTPIPPPSGGGSGVGPCTSWTDGDEVMACCSVETSTGAIFDDVADQASQLLFELSGRLFSGTCQKTVRPPCLSCGCGYQVLSRGHVIGPWDWGGWSYNDFCDYCLVSCAPSRVKLSGYPVREITEVKIDGDVLAASEYTLYQQRYVTRLNDGHWPIQQDLTLEDSEDNTFSITYTYGMDPPLMGRQAATQLACELYKACDANLSCSLPTGVIRETRQGVTIEKLGFTSWGFTPSARARAGRPSGWNTGLSQVDAFLNTYNAAGLKRRPTFYAPGKRQYAQGFG